MSPGAQRKDRKRGSAPSGLASRGRVSPSLLLPILLALVAALVAFAHRPVLDAEADCFDDFQYIDENPLVMNPSWDSAARFLREVSKPSTVTGYYQPLTMISLMLDVAAGGSPVDLRPFHATSLALHVANTVLLGLILYALFRNAWASAAAALLFGLHPMTVEPIAWSSERKTLLSSFFALASVLAYIGYARRSDSGSGDGVDEQDVGSNERSNVRDSRMHTRLDARSWVVYAVSVVAYLLALLAKPTATTLPAALLLLSYWPLRRLFAGDRTDGAVAGRFRPRARVVLEIVPFLVIGAISAVITYVSQRDAGGVATPGAGYDGARIPLILAYDVYLYARNILVPSWLIPHNPFPEPLGLGNARIVGGLALLLLGGAIVGASLRRTRALFVAMAIVCVLIFPTLQLVQFSYSVISDKYFYLPALGLLLLVTWGLDRLGARFGSRSKAGIAALVVLVCAVAIAEAAATRRQLGYWRTTETLDRRLIALNPENSEFHFDLGNALWDQGRLDEAHRELELAVQLDSTNVRALNNLALSAAFRDEESRAIELWRQTLRHHPGNYVARCNLAFYALERRGRIPEARDQYAQALRDYQEEKNQGRRARAIGRADPGAPSQVHAMLGHAHLLLGETEPALRNLRESIRLPQPFPLAFAWLAETLISSARHSIATGWESGAASEGSISSSPTSDPAARAAFDEVGAEASAEFHRLLETAGPREAFSALAARLHAAGASESARVASEIAAELAQEETAGMR